MALTYKQQKQERSAPGIEGFLRDRNYQDVHLEDGSTQWRVANEDAPSFGVMENNLEGARSPFNEFVNDPYVGDRYYIDRATVENPGMGYSQVGYQPNYLQADEFGDTYIPAQLQRQWHEKVYSPNHRNKDDWMTMMPFAFGALAAGGLASGAFGGGAAGGMAGGSALPFGSALAGTEAAALLAPAAPGGLTASMIPGLGTGVSFGTVPGATLSSFGLGGAGGAFGAEGLFSDLASWGGGGGADFDTSAVMGNGSNSFNGIDFNNFNPTNSTEGTNPFSTGEGMYNPSQWNTGMFGSQTGGLASEITPNFLSQAGGAPLSGMGGAAASGAGISGLGGSSFMDILSNILGKPQIPGMPNSTGGNIATSLANYFIQSQKQDQLSSAATQAANLNNPMSQSQRLPFQAAYANLMLNPNSYSQTPYAQGMTNQVNQAFQANVGKYGPSGTVFSDYLKNYQNVLGQDYFKLADQLGMAGGFNQGTGGAGTAFGNLAGQAANAGSSAFEGFGKLFSNTGSAQNSNSPFQITVNPTTGTSTYSG